MSEMFSGQAPEALDLLLRRRSASAKGLGEPGPSEEQVQLILQAGVRVPDHGKLAPWRFLLFSGEGRAEFGALLARIIAEREPDAGDFRLEMERKRFLRAPLVIGVISSPNAGKPVPEWEQRLSSGAVCQNMVIAATALGFGVQWITEWYAYDEAVNQALGLAEQERVAGYLYFGSRTESLRDRERPDPTKLAQAWRAP
jgi:nitroreductase